jgi:hypothetical protein
MHRCVVVSEARAHANGSRCHGPVGTKLLVMVEAEAIGGNRLKSDKSVLKTSRLCEGFCQGA